MELTSPPEAAGERLDQFLAVPLGSRARAQRLIDEGGVLVDGVARQKRHKLRGGEVIVIAEDPVAGVVADGPQAPFTVPYEDEHLMVVDKPAGVVVHPARGNWTGTLAQALAARGAAGGEPERPGIVHRLDRDTSGLLVVARSEAVHRALKEAIQARTVTREYLTLVEGRPPARSGTIDAPLGRDRRVRTRMSSDTDMPRDAITHFEIAEALPGTTLLRVRLETGRTHQIRAHLQAIGHPVVGDPDYGANLKGPGPFMLGRQFLHAARLAFDHPVTGERIDVESPLPPDLDAALSRARTAT
ncbi:MAG: pseudouridine synthase, RluA family [Solirubrobacterales bacterium]|nr:pseudouridine synthase, RluA family [Solirubrobacterales bacterium]